MQMNAIGIVCSSLGESLRFYRKLGVAFPSYDEGTVHYEADLGGGIRLMLDSEQTVASFTPGYTTPKGNDRISLAVEVDAPIDVDATHQAIVDAGFHSVLAPFDAVWGQRYATVADPDDNHVDIYAPLTPTDR